MLKAWPSQQVAERWLHEFYTRLSNEPGSLHYLYLDNAEAVYTGTVSSGATVDEGYAMSGRSEIAAFFGCPTIAAKFCGSKVQVDAVHPVTNPIGLNALSISVRGTLFLPVELSPGLYESAEYTHFLTLSPAQRFSNQPVAYMAATEFLHISRKPVIPPTVTESVIQPPVIDKPAPFHAGIATSELPLLSHPPHMIHQVQQVEVKTSRSALDAAPEQGGCSSSVRNSDLQQSSRMELAHPLMARRYGDELSLHAAAVTPRGSSETKNMTTGQIAEAVNDALRDLNCEGRCIHAMRPLNGTQARAFFFLHFNRIDLVEKLRKLGTIEIAGHAVRLSAVKRKYNTNSSVSGGSHGHGGSTYSGGGGGLMKNHHRSSFKNVSVFAAPPTTDQTSNTQHHSEDPSGALPSPRPPSAASNKLTDKAAAPLPPTEISAETVATTGEMSADNKLPQAPSSSSRRSNNKASKFKKSFIKI